jgi:ABC-type multidrug transport system fused ATPase/permease subunit
VSASKRRGRQAWQLLRLLRYARPYWLPILATAVFSFAYAGGLTGRAYLMAPLLDGIVLPTAKVSSLTDAMETMGTETTPPAELDAQRRALEENVARSWRTLLLWAGVLIVGMPLVHWVRDYTGEWVMTRLLVDVQGAVAGKLLRLPLARHQADRRGDFISRTLSDSSAANRAQALVFGEAIQDLAIVVTATAAMFFVNWRLALLAAAVGPPILAVLSAFGHRIRRTSRSRQEQIAEVVQRIMQMLAGIKVIKAFRAEGLERDALVRELHRYFRRSVRALRTRVISRSVVELVTQAGFVLMLLAGVAAIVRGAWDLTPGQLAAFVGVSAMVYRPMKNLTRLYNSVQEALPSAERLFEVLDAEEEPMDAPDAVRVERIRERIRLRGVHFHYGREEVLRGVDLEIRTGEVVALVGRTGAGKTTIADLLLRFHDPDAGSVELDGIDLRRIRRDSLHELTAVVTQEPFLFDTTILENIRYGRPDASFEEVVAAARAAHADEFVAQLPEGYQTEVGEAGVRLSGGQRQRLTIARAILRDPQLLIFDEATSSLDAVAEKYVQEAIGALMKGRTVLLIAHRLATVKAADKIAVIEGGRVTAIGTHDELYARDGLYRELAELQFTEA